MTDEKVVVEKRERALAFGNFRGTLAAAGNHLTVDCARNLSII
jgi:hypothetical protein